MSNDLLYLKQNAQTEPLFDQWYTWPHLVPPATAARNLTERHLRIMDSYISAAQVHANAVKNPNMAGGPFIDYGGRRVDEVRALRDRIKAARPHLLELSGAIAELDALLRTNANGLSLEPLYPKVPEPLRGYVELHYDLNNHPAFTLIEALLYRSRYYDRSAQSVLLTQTTGDDRPFILSTPRLFDDQSVHLRVPFEHECLDCLFALKREPQCWTKIRDLFDGVVEPGKEARLRDFFTPEPGRPYLPYSGDGVRWRYFGHACILVEAGGVSVLFDPVLSYTYESSISRYTYEDLPDRIDFVVITHNHQDHILFETLLQLRHKIGTIVVPRSGGGALQDPSIRLIFEHTGFRNVVELGAFETLRCREITITGLPFIGEHADLNIRSKLIYLVEIGRHRLLFAADSRNVEPRTYEHVQRDVGDVDALFLGMECHGAPLTWLYGPLLTQPMDRQMNRSRRLAGSNYEQAIDLVRRFNCREVYVYAMGQEPWLNYIMSLKYTEESLPIVESNRLIEECVRRDVVAERLFGEKEILLPA
jgi:L-ascorbate metabolism protein UlaG (beta-lactamase superfamily)